MEADPWIVPPPTTSAELGNIAPVGKLGGLVLKSMALPKPNRHWLF
jgi:hypothetical protein